jgi:nicotinamide-nucleotide amidase
VWFAWQVDGRLSSETKRFDGDRAAIREQTVDHALQRLIDKIGEWQP